MYNTHSDAIQWQIPDFLSNGDSNVCIFSIYLLKLPPENIDLENLGQGHGVQFSQWRHSMENIKIYKCCFYIFILSKVRSMRTKVADTHRDSQKHTQTETDKP